LAAYVKEIIRANKLFDGEYVEPYAGGAAIGLELLFQEYVHRIHINDLSQPVYSFWKAVLNDTEELCRLIRNTRLTVAAWDRQKRIFANPADYSYVQLGFATFFLNRTNRSGILNAGVIGGRDQSGPWKMNARYNAAELIFRIESIAKMRRRIKLTRSDALALLRHGLTRWTDKTLIYLDPPYYEQGRELYYDYYQPKDHADLVVGIRHLVPSGSERGGLLGPIIGFRRGPPPTRSFQGPCGGMAAVARPSGGLRRTGTKRLIFTTSRLYPPEYGRSSVDRVLRQRCPDRRFVFRIPKRGVPCGLHSPREPRGERGHVLRPDAEDPGSRRAD
jgi:site-specific DNA-adenine methylase